MPPPHRDLRPRTTRNRPYPVLKVLKRSVVLAVAHPRGVYLFLSLFAVSRQFYK